MTAGSLPFAASPNVGSPYAASPYGASPYGASPYDATMAGVGAAMPQVASSQPLAAAGIPGIGNLAIPARPVA
jgi:hypothetical protein